MCEAESGLHGCLGEADRLEGCSYCGDLPAHTSQEFHLVAAADEQLVVGRELSAEVARFDLAVVVLGVHCPDAARRDDEVIDVAACPGHLAIVEHDCDARERVVQWQREAALALRTPDSNLRGLWLVGHELGDSPDSTGAPLGFDLAVVSLVAPFVLVTRRDAADPVIDHRRRCE